MERVLHVVRTGQYGECRIDVEPADQPLAHEVFFYLVGGSVSLEKARRCAELLNAKATRDAVKQAGEAACCG